MKEREKEKDARYTNGHLFTTISVSGTTLCFACNKSITAKEALICPSELPHCPVHAPRRSCPLRLPPACPPLSHPLLPTLSPPASVFPSPPPSHCGNPRSGPWSWDASESNPHAPPAPNLPPHWGGFGVGGQGGMLLQREDGILLPRGWRCYC